MDVIREAFVWLGFWVMVLDLLIIFPLLLYLRHLSRNKIICVAYILHHWLQNFESGYEYEDAIRDLKKVKEVV